MLNENTFHVMKSTGKMNTIYLPYHWLCDFEIGKMTSLSSYPSIYKMGIIIPNRIGMWLKRGMHESEF